MNKRCSKCRQEKPKDSFRLDKTKKDGLSNNCTECKRKYEELWRERNREAIKSRQRKSYRDNSEEVAKKRREKYDPIKAKARWMAKAVPQEKCKFCDEIGERHHPDYSKPLIVVSLCKSHHKKVHDGTIKL